MLKAILAFWLSFVLSASAFATTYPNFVSAREDAIRKRLKYFIAPCLVEPQACGLNEKERIWLEEIFTEDLPETPVPTALTLTFKEAVQSTFIGLFAKSEPQLSESLASKLFQYLLVRENTVPLEVEGRFIRAYLIQSPIDADTRDAFLLFQTPTGSRDLTPLLSESLKCEGRVRLIDITISPYAYEHPVVRGSVNWLCEDQRKTAHFALQTTVLKVEISMESTCEDALK